MKSFYSISIPKPCHENWNTMTLNEKGRFCDSCAKTVIDFTKMDTSEIQDILHQNRNNRICGHIRQEQLDTINIQIPIDSFSYATNFHKLFLLALLIAMGTTLLNCTNSNNKVQKIEKVEIIDSISKIEKPVFKSSDSVKVNTRIKHKIPKPIIQPPIIPEITGEIVEVMGIMIPEIDKNAPIPFELIENPPEFRDTPKKLSAVEKKRLFKEGITKFVHTNFRVPQGDLSITGLQKIYTKFIIDDFGTIQDIQIRSNHPYFEKEAKRVINLLPQFIPATQGGKNVAINYTLPITFQMED